MGAKSVVYGGDGRWLGGLQGVGQFDDYGLRFYGLSFEANCGIMGVMRGKNGAWRGMLVYFLYGETELDHLRKDPRMGAVIDRIGRIERAVDPDLFSSVVHHIIGQQISTKAQETIWRRMQAALGAVNAEAVLAAGEAKLQALGVTFRKAAYLTDFAAQVHTGVFDLEAVTQLPDADAIQALSRLKGIGVWTAEMILLFCLQRPDIFSYDDLAIQRGLRMVYHHRAISRPLFEKYRRRFHPYGSVASLYLWAVAGGAIPELKDYKPKNKPNRKPKNKGN